MKEAMEIIQDKLDGIFKYVLDGDPLDQEVIDGYRAGLKGAIKDLSTGKTIVDFQEELNINTNYDSQSYYGGYCSALRYVIKVLKGEAI